MFYDVLCLLLTAFLLSLLRKTFCGLKLKFLLTMQVATCRRYNEGNKFRYDQRWIEWYEKRWFDIQCVRSSELIRLPVERALSRSFYNYQTLLWYDFMFGFAFTTGAVACKSFNFSVGIWCKTLIALIGKHLNEHVLKSIRWRVSFIIVCTLN